MLYRPYGLYKYPWERKHRRAFFRGTGYCSGYHHGLAACSRSYFAHRSHYCDACNELIDAGGWQQAAGSRQQAAGSRQQAAGSGAAAARRACRLAPPAAWSRPPGSQPGLHKAPRPCAAPGLIHDSVVGGAELKDLPNGHEPGKQVVPMVGPRQLTSLRTCRTVCSLGALAGHAAADRRARACPHLQRQYTHLREHARYRYLLHLDGLSASYRLGLLLSTDSLVLRQRSPYIEYLSRCAGGSRLRGGAAGAPPGKPHWPPAGAASAGAASAAAGAPAHRRCTQGRAGSV
jgi:hypothetical protein